MPRLAPGTHEGTCPMKLTDRPLNDTDHTHDDADRSTQSIHDEARRQNEYLDWANRRWARAQRDAAVQSHRSHQRLVEARQNQSPGA